MKTETEVLANMVDKTRELTNIYLHFLKDVDPHRVFESNGVQLNTVFWLMAHLPVTQNFLLLRANGGEVIKIPWARQFGLGSVPSAKEDCPPIDEVRDVMKTVHEKAVAHISTLNLDLLDTDNTIGFEFAGEKSVRSLIVHSIRHEATHAGHLGWLCKLHGIKTI